MAQKTQPSKTEDTGLTPAAAKLLNLSFQTEVESFAKTNSMSVAKIRCTYDPDGMIRFTVEMRQAGSETTLANKDLAAYGIKAKCGEAVFSGTREYKLCGIRKGGQNLIVERDGKKYLVKTDALKLKDGSPVSGWIA